EDEHVLRKHLVRLFVREGFEVDSAATRAEAAEKLAARGFGALLIDVCLPDGDGLDLLGELGMDHRPAVTIVMTAFSTPQNDARAADLGVQRVLRKPVDLCQVLAVMRGETAAVP